MMEAQASGAASGAPSFGHRSCTASAIGSSSRALPSRSTAASSRCAVAARPRCPWCTRTPLRRARCAPRSVDAAGGRAYNLTTDFPLTVAELVATRRRSRPPNPRTVPLAPRIARALQDARAGTHAIGRRDLGGHAMGSFEMLVHDNPVLLRARPERAQVGAHDSPRGRRAGAFRWWKAHHGSA